MEALGIALGWLIAAALAVAGQRAAAHGLRTLLMARDPLCGELADSRAYHRSLWSTDRPESVLALIALVVSGCLVAAGLQTSAWLLVPAELLWLGVLVWDTDLNRTGKPTRPWSVAGEEQTHGHLDLPSADCRNS